MLTAEYLAENVIEIKYTGGIIGDHVDLLSPKDCLKFIKDIRNALFEYKKITGRSLDMENPK